MDSVNAFVAVTYGMKLTDASSHCGRYLGATRARHADGKAYVDLSRLNSFKDQKSI
jgi:hypothetical protein